jgi:hypothetical protein
MQPPVRAEGSHAVGAGASQKNVAGTGGRLKMLKRFRDYIEHGSWEDDLEKGDDLLAAFCWAAIVFASGYFGLGIIRAIITGAL